MSLRSLVLDWSVDGALGIAFLALLAAIGVLYVLAAAVGTSRDRRGRPWPRRRSLCFLAGLVALVVDLYSGLGYEADARLAAHMLEHMIMLVLVAPLLVAGAPIRLALFALPRDRRRVLARCLHSRPLQALTSPIGSIAVFSAVLLVSHLPAFYGLTLENPYAHEAEHAAYLGCAVLVWAPLLGVDPLPNRLAPRGQLLCMAACMLPMVAIGGWLAAAPGVVYGHYELVLGAAAPGDQHLAGAIMLIGCLPAVAVPGLIKPRPRAARTALV